MAIVEPIHYAKLIDNIQKDRIARNEPVMAGVDLTSGQSDKTSVSILGDAVAATRAAAISKAREMFVSGKIFMTGYDMYGNRQVATLSPTQAAIQNEMESQGIQKLSPNNIGYSLKDLYEQEQKKVAALTDELSGARDEIERLRAIIVGKPLPTPKKMGAPSRGFGFGPMTGTPAQIASLLGDDE